jgi:hypothetical protein
VVRERLQVQVSREFKVRVKLVVLEGVKVEHQSLQMEDQDVRCLSVESSLGYLNLLLAARALVVIDLLSSSIKFE